MSILFFIEALIIIFAVFLLYMSIAHLKTIPRGILEWAIWIAAICIIVSWILGYMPR